MEIKARIKGPDECSNEVEKSSIPKNKRQWNKAKHHISRGEEEKRWLMGKLGGEMAANGKDK